MFRKPLNKPGLEVALYGDTVDSTTARKAVDSPATVIPPGTDFGYWLLVIGKRRTTN
jgi:hypothetical protein